MSDDTISRQAAINSPVKMIAQGLDWVPVYHLEQLPSAERLGTWTTRRTMYHDGETYCDQCGWTWEAMTHGKINVTRTPFCPNCGARMRMTRE